MRSRLPVTILFATLAAPVIAAQTTPSPALLVLAKEASTLAIVDPSTLKVVWTAPAGPDPHEVIASPDGKLAYISNYGFGAYHTISRVDLEARKALTPIELGPLTGPHGLTFAGGKLYFTAEGAKVIGRYNPATGKVDWVFGTGQNRTHMVLVARNLDRIFTSNVSSATISIIDKVRAPAGGPPPLPNAPPSSHPPPPRAPRGPDWNQTLVAVGRGSEGFDVTPDETELWAANAGDGTISIVDLAGAKVAATLNANVAGANRLKFTPDGKRVFVSSLATGDLAVFDAASHREVKRLKLGRGAAGILMQPDGSRAFVACSPDNNVAVIDLKTLEVTGRIETARGPDGLAWAAH